MSILLRSRINLASAQLCLVRNASFFSRRKQQEEPEVEETTIAVRKPKSGQDMLSRQQLNLMAAKASLTTKRAYTPPDDVETRLQNIVENCVPNLKTSWQQVFLDDPMLKFKVVSKAVSEFNHDLPNHKLTEVSSVSDLLAYFSTSVTQTSAFEDLDKLDLPPNLHIIKEYIRFDPETDTMFGGKTAFPGEDSIVTSIKYKRKYKDIKMKKTVPGYVDKYNLGY